MKIGTRIALWTAVALVIGMSAWKGVVLTNRVAKMEDVVDTRPLRPAQIRYYGHFTAPDIELLRWDAGRALTYTHEGTLLVSGGAMDGRFVELAVPLMFDGRQAPIVQAPFDLTGGWLLTLPGEIPRVGAALEMQDGLQLVVGYDAYGTAGRDYNGLLLVGLGDTHLGPIREGVSHPFHVNAWVGGLAEVPPAWAARFGGRTVLASGGEMEGGGSKQTSAGPSLYLFDPAAPESAMVVAYHPSSRPARVGFSTCVDDDPDMEFCSTSTWEDAAWIAGTVLLFGSDCDSTSYYSLRDGEGLCRENKGQVCRGSYHARILFFNPAYFGKVNPADVEPYAMMDMPWFTNCQPGIGGVAVSPSGLIFVVERKDGQQLKIHVMGVGA